jgi:hypothetical protein
LKRYDAAIDEAIAGSHLIGGATDQGSGRDPNVNWQGGKVVRGGEVYNEWGGVRGHEGAHAYRMQVEAALAAERNRAAVADDRQAIDSHPVHTVKVQGDGTLTANINAPKGTDVTLGGGGIFRKLTVNRQQQMEPARGGPVDGPNPAAAGF